MGVADNKSYKNEKPYFLAGRGLNSEDVPSLEGQPKINDTIKKNPYKSNVEIEDKEIVLEPDLSAIFSAKGKKHSGGGIDVMLKPNSFVFSNDKGLSFSQKECELFEFKAGGKYKGKSYTPAEVLNKNVDTKHYNRLVNNIKDVKQDELTKRSSTMMLEKYIGTLGNIGYLQEAKKGFPDGLPDFSNGTAPVYDTDLKKEIMEQKQYAKYGGKINPYKSMAEGGTPDFECPCGRDAKGNCLPCNDYSKVQPFISKAKTMGAAPTGYNQIYAGQQGSMYSQSTPGQTRKKPTVQEEAAYARYLSTETPEQRARRKSRESQQAGQDNFAWVPKVGLSLDDTTVSQQRNPYKSVSGFDFTPDTPVQNLSVLSITGQPQGVKRADWQFTPWQKLSQLYNLSQLAGVKRYMPMRSHFNPSYTEPYLVNPEQAVSDAKGVANQQVSSFNSLNPILGNAQKAGAYGQFLNQIPGIRSQYDNANAGTINQSRQYNNQVKNNATGINMNNDQQYYQQVINGLQNFDNMKQFQSDKYMNNVLRDVETNQSLAYNLLTQKPLSGGKLPYEYDWRTGNFKRNPMNLLDVQNDSKSDLYTSLAGKLMEKVNRGEKLTKEEVDFFKGLSLGKIPFTQKKGGKVGYNPYK